VRGFIELTLRTNDQVLINVSSIATVVPDYGGDGCLIEVFSGAEVSVKDPYHVVIGEIGAAQEEA
jgi:hypothetical protein